jgi:hypothetical protein
MRSTHRSSPAVLQRLLEEALATDERICTASDGAESIHHRDLRLLLPLSNCCVEMNAGWLQQACATWVPIDDVAPYKPWNRAASDDAGPGGRSALSPALTVSFSFVGADPLGCVVVWFLSYFFC